MRIVRKISICLIIIIALSLILIACGKDANEKYLNRNISQIDIEDNDNFSSFKLLDKDIENKDMFLIGESHMVKDNFKIHFKMLEYFKKKTNFKYLLWESSSLGAKKYNEYLKSGDQKIIMNVNSEEELEFWKKTYEFNKVLKEEDKLIVVGPDTCNLEASVKYLIDDLSNKDITDKMKEALILLKDYEEYIKTFIDMEDDQEDMKKYVSILEENKVKFMKIYECVKGDINSYKELLKDESFNFEYELDNIKNLLDIQEKSLKSYTETMDFANILAIRDIIIADNFKKLYNNLPKGKYFGKYGSTHVYQKEILSEDGIKTSNFAAEINKENSPLRGKILSIVMFYKNCMSAQNIIHVVNSYKTNETLDNYLNTNHTLIRLTGNNSPYDKKLEWDFIEKEYGSPTGGVTTDYFQYLLIVKDSKEETMINP